jgi:hypothetical protein
MEHLESSLNDVVEIYAELDPQTNSYQSLKPVNDQVRQKTRSFLIIIINEFLSPEGIRTETIETQSAALHTFFDTTSPAVLWLEQVLSEGRMDGACHQLIKDCTAELLHLKQEKVVPTQSYQKVKDMEGFLTTLKQQQPYASTVTQRALTKSLISMLESISSFKHTTDEAAQGWLNQVLKSLPYITSGLGMGLFIQELALIYGLTYSVSLGAKWLEKSSSERWKTVAQATQTYSRAVQEVSNSLVCYFVKANFMAFDGAYLNDYQSKQKTQWFSGLRQGSYKSGQMQKAVKKLLEIDDTDASNEEKIAQAKEVLDTLVADKGIMGNGELARGTLNTALSIFVPPSPEKPTKEDGFKIFSNSGVIP